MAAVETQPEQRVVEQAARGVNVPSAISFRVLASVERARLPWRNVR
jgi:hypothetical protein